MDKVVDIWRVGNTGLRNPMRIHDGFKVFAESSFVGNLHGKENAEIPFEHLLNEKGIIKTGATTKSDGTYARKWRNAFVRYGLIYDSFKKGEEDLQKKLGKKDEITPFGREFLKADTFPAVQECFLRSLSVEKEPLPGTKDYYFSPLRWLLTIMLKLEERTKSSEISRLEFALWGQATDPRYDIDEVIDQILDLRERRKKATAKRKFDREERNKRKEEGHYPYKSENFFEYCDMNMRYLRISGVLQRKGRGLIIVPEKHLIAEKLAKATASKKSKLEVQKVLTTMPELPTDNMKVALAVLKDLENTLKKRHIVYDISDLSLNTPNEINIARNRLEEQLSQKKEIQYAEEQRQQWQEIADYMDLLIQGKSKRVYDDDDEKEIEIPKDETPAYLEWVLWRAALAIDHLVNEPFEVRGFRLDSDFLPVSAAGGGRGDLYCEFDNCMVLIEVTMSTSSRQEAMEGEPVRRHVSDAVLKYHKPVYCFFIAIKVDMNTTETFRHGVWYASGEKQRLSILPLTLAQFRKYFVNAFEKGNGQASPKQFVKLIDTCMKQRDVMETPDWIKYIDDEVEAGVQ